jgi:long-chain acyl-CoA synthetase
MRVHSLSMKSEYVALEKLEGMYALDPLFATLMVHGDSTRSSLVAVAVLDPVQAATLVSSVLGRSINQADIAGLEQAVQDKRVRKAVVKSLAKVGRKHKLNGFEMIKGVHLTMSPLPDDVVTPTFKVKRSVEMTKP